MFKLIMFVFCLLTLQQLVIVTAAVNELWIDVNPPTILLGVSPKLNVNCTFSMKNNTDMAGFVSLTLLRGNALGENFQQLAGITEFSPSSVTLATQEKVSATGVHSQTGESFLLLSWNYPTDTQAGVYQCIAHGLDELGNHMEAVNTSVVTSTEPEFSDILAFLHQIELENQCLQDTIAALKDFRAMDFLGTHENTDYYISREGLQYFTEVQNACKSYGGQLLEINDANEDNAVKGYLNSVQSFTWIIIGGTRTASEGTWVYPSTNQSITYTNWASGEPAASGNCLWLSRASSWQMYADDCHYNSINSNWHFVCELPPQC